MIVRTLLIAAALLGGTAQSRRKHRPVRRQPAEAGRYPRRARQDLGHRCAGHRGQGTCAKARQDQASGDTKGCITATTQALQILQNTGKK
ncbi:hypothetical protein P4193_23795 [Pseudomonas aeruginosa]|nr:hypothetical protein [Pseudomonas aeruginosa]